MGLGVAEQPIAACQGVAEVLSAERIMPWGVGL
jgi:hypothetical protein